MAFNAVKTHQHQGAAKRWARAWMLFWACVCFMVSATASAPIAGTVIRIDAKATYISADSIAPQSVRSNEVYATVAGIQALALTQDHTFQRPIGSMVLFPHLLTNQGNIASSYHFSLDTNGCATPNQGFQSVTLNYDVDSNGILDNKDSKLNFDSIGALTLAPGESASLLLQSAPLVNAYGGMSCYRLVVTTDTVGLPVLQTANTDTVIGSPNAAVLLNKSVSYSGLAQPGVSVLNYLINATNIGNALAAPSDRSPGAATVVVDGKPAVLMLIRDVLPTGTQYVAGSLNTIIAGSVRLFRMANDAPFTYHSAPAPNNGSPQGYDDAGVVEVAVGLPTGLPPNAAVSFGFQARLLNTASASVNNSAIANFHDGTKPSEVVSNVSVVKTTSEILGLAKAASVPIANIDSNGKPDGTATVRFQLLAKNYGHGTLYNTGVTDVLENMSGGLGQYTAAIQPGVGQYTIPTGSLKLVSQDGVGTHATVNSLYTGQASHAELLAAGAVLQPGGSVTVQFDVRFNLSGLPNTLYNNAIGHAAIDPYSADTVNAGSVNGLDPDIFHDGNPNAHAARTPYLGNAPVISLQKTIAPARPVAGAVGVYDLDITLQVKNESLQDIAGVRLADNLNCAFEMDLAQGHFGNWSITVPPTALKGLLTPSVTFTGAAPCDRGKQNMADPFFSFPFENALAVVDGQRTLPAGQTELIKFTVRANLKPDAIGNRPITTNRAWSAVLYTPNATEIVGDVGRNGLTWATSASAVAVLGDPSGIVYNSLTRQPVEGARVTMTRLSCNTTTASSITKEQLFGDSSIYTFNSDGSVTVTTDASGAYSFVLKSPPVNDLCKYGFSVVPPNASGLTFPSINIPVHAGVYEGCAAVDRLGVPPLGRSTTYYLQVMAGKDPNGLANCEVSNNNIPLDPTNSSGLILQKNASVSTVEVGDLLGYSLKVSNASHGPISQLSIKDQLPVGLRFVAGSVRWNGNRIADPQGGAGPELLFNLPVTETSPLASGDSITLSYQVRVGINAPVGVDAINRAWAQSGGTSRPLVSNEADARVRVQGGVFATEAYAFGKVFLDCNKSGIQEDAETGIPGVRLFLEDGTAVVTDIEGKWSLYGLRPVTHVLRLDTSSLPPGAQLALLEPRQSGQVDSLFMDLKNGEWHKANFAVQNCDYPGLRDSVSARRDAITKLPALESEGARSSVRLSPDGKSMPVADVRGLPAAGSIDSLGNLKGAPIISSPLISLSGAIDGVDYAHGQSANPPVPPSASTAAVRTTPLPAGSSEPALLEESLFDKDRSLAFLDLQDRQVMSGTLANIRVKGSLGSRLVLQVNGSLVDESRVGKRARIESRQLEAWEYIAVPLQPDVNTVTVQEVDSFGISRASTSIQITAPGPLAQIVIDVARTAKADPGIRLPVTIRLLDSQGTPVTVRTPVTLESVASRWDTNDLNPMEAGVQVMIQGASATFDLVPPAIPGDGRIRISAGTLQSEARIVFLPDLRPLIGIGVLEGVINVRNPGAIPLGAARASDAFESELRGWAGQGGDTSNNGRTAFFFKGTVQGSYLLTAAYDSDKTTATTMFRDIQPDQFYPIYGDSASKTFDAQSSQRLYVRIDKNRSYLLFGDYNTASSPEVRKLSQVSRTATGLQHVYNSEALRVTSHYSRDALRQIVEEFPANGTSGPYSLASAGASDLFSNSETVQLVVRDRNQPNVVLSTVNLARFVDYTVSPLGKTILLTRPVSSLDAELNPQSIRINYVVDTGGQVFDVGGVDFQLRLSEQLQLGAVAEYDGTPNDTRKLTAVTALASVGDGTVVRAELVGTQSDLKGEGQAFGLELRHDDKLLKYNFNVQTSDSGFDNPSAAIASGHSEVRGHLDYQINADTHLKADLVFTQDNSLSGTSNANAVQSQGVSVAIQKAISSAVTVEAGVRSGNYDTSAATNFDYRSVSSGTPGVASAGTGNVHDQVALRARVTVNIPDVPKAQVFVEGEQDVNDPNRHIAAIGGTYSLNDKARLYGRYEVISSLGSEYALTNGMQRNVGLVGIESNYMQGGRVYDEYRIADTIDGRAMQSAMGVRNTFEVSEGLRLTGGLEQVSALPSANGTSTGESKAVTGAVDWLGTGVYKDRLRGSAALELRDAVDATSSLFSLGVAYKLDPDWSLLGRTALNRVGSRTDGSIHWLEREQIGLAYRPVGQDIWNTLLRYEHKADTWDGTLSTTVLSVNTYTDILSAHLNYQPRRGDIVSSRIAAKQSTSSSDGVHSSYGAQLLYVRWTHDINRDWDFGVQAGLLFGDGDTRQHTLGAELGYQVSRGLWLSAGYNVLGLHDPELAGADYTDSGTYLRLRFKFDERLFNRETSAGAELR